MGRGKTAELILNWDVRNMDEYLMILEANAQVIWFIGMVQRMFGNMVVVRNRDMGKTVWKGLLDASFSFLELEKRVVVMGLGQELGNM
jgi:hypothetical protein